MPLDFTWSTPSTTPATATAGPLAGQPTWRQVSGAVRRIVDRRRDADG